MGRLYIPHKGADAEVGALTFAQPIELEAADGAIGIRHGVALITKSGSLAALTLAAPVAGPTEAGGDDGKVLHILSTTALAHTVTIAGGLNGAGTAADVGTFTAAIGNRFSVVAYNGVWWAFGATVNVTFA